MSELPLGGGGLNYAPTTCSTPHRRCTPALHLACLSPATRKLCTSHGGGVVRLPSQSPVLYLTYHCLACLFCVSCAHHPSLALHVCSPPHTPASPRVPVSRLTHLLSALCACSASRHPSPTLRTCTHLVHPFPTSRV
ncbi:hypothetical protein OBBRIDRAFT_797019 [Obba rivulosa]|uniref:Uncharacterized protein n=1 Tax=Obba rivulosa TaxID=1052685 RepID=A0A8E2ALZ2_9APHY|nr:hypothetical protein OBBRIDRAFT_797019 [Obba rivulosa]